MNYKKVKWSTIVEYIYPEWGTYLDTADTSTIKEWTVFRDEILFNMGLKFHNPNRSGNISKIYALIVDEKKWLLTKLKYGIV